MKFFIIFAVLAVNCNAYALSKRSAQVPGVWDALQALRGNKSLTVQEQQDLIANAVPGKDYPINAVIPDKAVDCKSYNQPGFYVDDSAPSNCQVFVRCDDNGYPESFLCPNKTLFNQIVLVCDWFFNIDCKSSAQFADYSNSRLGNATANLLDTPPESAESNATLEIPAKTQGRAKPSEGNENTTAPEPAPTDAATENATTAAATTKATTIAAAAKKAATKAVTIAAAAKNAANKTATTVAGAKKLATKAATTVVAARKAVTKAATTAAATEAATTASEAATTAAAETEAAAEAATTAGFKGSVSVSGSVS